MSARDELANLIASVTIDTTSGDVLRVHPDGETPVFEGDQRTADAILAAGYRRLCTITTAEELDALPVGSVVLHNGRAFQHYPAYPAPFDEYQKWKCGDGGFVRSTKDGSTILPATVLYEPEQP